jgi:ParB/RepB/Spo0J family partition protein
MNAPTRAVELAEPKIELIPCAAIAPSETHIQQLRRKRYDMEALKDLTASIVKLGVQQPGIVRKLPALRGLAAYELVCGERRWRASRQADVAHFPAIIRELDDAEVLEIQLVENIQRESLHPLEEAAGYDELMKVGKITADQVGDKVGLSRSWVYSRLNLLKLDGAARVALEDGRLDVSRALVVASVAQPNQRAEALRLALERGYNDKPMYSVRELRHKIVGEKLSMPLRGAPFPMDDAKLLPDMGACGPLPLPHRQLRPRGARSRRLHKPRVLPPEGQGAGRAHAPGRARRRRQGPARRGRPPALAVGEDGLQPHRPRPRRRGRRRLPREGAQAAEGDREGDRRGRRSGRRARGLAAVSRMAGARGALAAAHLPRAPRGPEVHPIVIEDPKTKAVRELLPFKEAQRLLKKAGIDLPSYYNRKRPTPPQRRREQGRRHARGERREGASSSRAGEGVPPARAEGRVPEDQGHAHQGDPAARWSRTPTPTTEALELLFDHHDLRKLGEADLMRLLLADRASTTSSITWGKARNWSSSRSR